MKLALIGASLAVLAGCSGPTNSGQLGVSSVTNPNVTGTVFTIVFENEAADTILQPSNPNFYAALASERERHGIHLDDAPEPAELHPAHVRQHERHHERQRPESERAAADATTIVDQLDAAGVSVARVHGEHGRAVQVRLDGPLLGAPQPVPLLRVDARRTRSAARTTSSTSTRTSRPTSTPAPTSTCGSRRTCATTCTTAAAPSRTRGSVRRSRRSPASQAYQERRRDLHPLRRRRACASSARRPTSRRS